MKSALRRRSGRNIRTWAYIDDYRKLVEEIIAYLEPKIAEQIKRRPHYIETVGGWPTLDNAHNAGTSGGGVGLSRLRVLAQEHRPVHCLGLSRDGENFGKATDESVSIGAPPCYEGDYQRGAR